MKIHLFPYALIRHSGLSVQQTASWRLNLTHQWLQEEKTFSQQLQLEKQLLCDLLFDAVQQEQDDKFRQQLICLKRQIYNSKEINTAVTEKVKDKLLADKLSVYLQLQTSHAKWLQRVCETYTTHLYQSIKLLQKLSVTEPVMRGILLSSPVLFDQLPAYIKKEPAAHKQSDHKITFSLLRYITRMSYKTSPFSTFTTTGTGVFENTPAPLHKGGSHIRVNNSLFVYLMGILPHHPSISEHLLLAPNITISQQEHTIRFLVNYFNVESFQQLQANAVIAEILKVLQTGPVTTRTLINHLVTVIPDALREDLRRYLLKLAATGLIRYELPITGIEEDWAHQAFTYFKGTGNSHTGLCELLTTLEHGRHSYANAGAQQRRQLLSTTAALVNSRLQQLQEAADLPDTTTPAAGATFRLLQFTRHTFRDNELFYEDGHHSEQEVLPAPVFHQLTKQADELLQLLTPMDIMKPVREQLLQFFLSRYLPADQVPVLTFYHDYYQYKTLSSALPTSSTDEAWKQQMEALLLPHMVAPPATINLDARCFPACANNEKALSRGMFLQLYRENGAYYGVLNASLPGMGKVPGRFLYMFDENITSQLRQFNERLYPSHLMMELNDASAFNANHHPPLLHHELQLPGGYNMYPASKQVPVTKVNVAYKEGQLTLLYENREIYAFDLNLETFSNRSHLYQLLAHFNADSRPSLQHFIQLTDGLYGSCHPRLNNAVYCWPRITYNHTLVIRRKTWQVAVKAIPLQLPGENPAAYYIRLNQWKDAQGLPDAVFVFLRKRGIKTSGGKKGGLADDYKPQYISFHQPVLILLLLKLLSRAGDDLWLEEVLPVPEHQAKEYLIQWYKYSSS
ncbi:lantibiotic dehydratase [Chitinophaga sp.]|uniref:lantibiotic dehydratase n=1 Tax=Chitinophaga sp. TaxID=1869181 RepID=UPI002D1990A8|nr:lantibiotic dehydratase [Chitinophaga sp.]HWV66867.1 lantibiotic dehydratase [Chitinophaga sp.]